MILVEELCEKQNISLVEPCRCIGQTSQNFNKKLQRETVAYKEILAIASILGIKYEHRFVTEDGFIIRISLNT